eukprot:gnl/Spiro4/23055_TR11395_c0_g1_i1.p1 gnl/Spiro4/23055_TR11395_c0_g1~~gnl/Spiro4/23055_TR11395_c0_g1_i1.p1  ORF type:complete len:650 (+),score=212.96 gnl/Spiro4/23055_TR11395_c0_g1_i1:149-2098(+)
MSAAGASPTAAWKSEAEGPMLPASPPPKKDSDAAAATTPSNPLHPFRSGWSMPDKNNVEAGHIGGDVGDSDDTPAGEGPKAPWVRAVMLALACLPPFAMWFTWGVFVFAAHDFTTGITIADVGVMFSIFALPNVVLPLFATGIFSRMGATRAGIACCLLAAVGVAVCLIAYATQCRSAWTLLLFGVFLFGISFELAQQACALLVTLYFNYNELLLAYSVFGGAGKLGLIVGAASAVSIDVNALYVALALLLACGVGAMVGAAWLEGGPVWVASACDVDAVASTERRDEVDPRELLTGLPLLFWVTVVLGALGNAAVESFVSFSPTFLHGVWHDLPHWEAFWLIFSVAALAGVLHAPCALLVDRYGQRPAFTAQGIAGHVLAMCFMMFFPAVSLPALYCLVGLSAAVFTAAHTPMLFLAYPKPKYFLYANAFHACIFYFALFLAYPTIGVLGLASSTPDPTAFDRGAISVFIVMFCVAGVLLLVVLWHDISTSGAGVTSLSLLSLSQDGEGGLVVEVEERSLATKDDLENTEFAVFSKHTIGLGLCNPRETATNHAFACAPSWRAESFVASQPAARTGVAGNAVAPSTPSGSGASGASATTVPASKYRPAPAHSLSHFMPAAGVSPLYQSDPSVFGKYESKPKTSAPSDD